MRTPLFRGQPIYATHIGAHWFKVDSDDPPSARSLRTLAAKALDADARRTCLSYASTIFATRAPRCFTMGVAGHLSRWILRHSSITVTTGTYVELIEAVRRDALDSTGSLFGAEPGTQASH